MPATRLPHDEIDERGPGAELVTSDGRALPLVAATLKAEAAGGIARVVLEQTFENPHDETLRVTYKMPLPADGAVSGYVFEIAGRVVAGRVDAKAKARETFEAALVQGKTAALLEQEKADIFTQTIGNVPPRTTLVARITVDQRLAWLPEGEWELRFPTVIGPRYIGSTDTEEDARAVDIAVSDAPLPVRLALEVRVRDELSPGHRIESPSHALDARDDNTVTLRAKEGARLDRDVVVRWGVAKPTASASIVVGKSEQHSGTFGLLTLVPPSPESRVAPIPRDLVVLLDTSGSMAGGPLDLAKRVVAQILDSLDERDQFEVIEFSSRPNRYHEGPLAGTTARKRDAVRWVMGRKAEGGTEMYSAVLDALRAMRSGAQRQVVLVTDGYIGGEQQIVKLCQERLPASCRLHVVGVGSATNRALSTALARAGRGAEILVGLGEDAERASKRLIDRTAAPILTDVTIEGSAVIARAPRQLPDVFAGAPLVCALELSPDGGDITVRGKLAQGEWTQRVRVPSAREAKGSGAIATLFGREHVADLETEWSTGERQRHIDTEIEETGLRFQIATRLTSWVAVDSEVSVDPYAPSRIEVVPQELPYGTTMQSFGVPAPAMMTRAGALSAPMPRSFAPSAMPRRLREPEPEAEAELDEPTSVRSMPARSSGATLGGAARPAPARPASAPASVRSAPAPIAPAAAPQQAAPPPPPASHAVPPSAVDPSYAELGASLSRAPKKRRRTWLFAIVAVLVILAFATLAWFLLR